MMLGAVPCSELASDIFGQVHLGAVRLVIALVIMDNHEV